jgi:DNA ligase D-like protein (predicted 3'-phosphoesterase)
MNLKYTLQVHEAVRAGTHYDIRIQIPQKRSLASWAIPKARIPTTKGDRVLAVRTNDHSHAFLYTDKLVIPKGEYGWGTINTLQKGEAVLEGWSDKYITLDFGVDNKYLNGRYSLIKFKGIKKGDEENLWVLIKLKDK